MYPSVLTKPPPPPPPGSGKSSLCKRFTGRLSADAPFPPYESTLGVDYFGHSFRIHDDAVQLSLPQPPPAHWGRPCSVPPSFSDGRPERAHRLLASSGLGWGINVFPYLDHAAGRALRATSVSLNHAVHRFKSWPAPSPSQRPRMCMHGDEQATCSCWVCLVLVFFKWWWWWL
jgi:hypothetical protein